MKEKEKRRRVGGGFTESVHLNWPRNMRVSVVVILRFFPRREVRYDSAFALDWCAIFIVILMLDSINKE